MNVNAWISIKNSLKFVSKGPINHIPALVQIMAWRRPGDKPLSEPMVVDLLTHKASFGWSELTPCETSQQDLRTIIMNTNGLAYRGLTAVDKLTPILTCDLNCCSNQSRSCFSLITCSYIQVSPSPLLTYITSCVASLWNSPTTQYRTMIIRRFRTLLWPVSPLLMPWSHPILAPSHWSGGSSGDRRRTTVSSWKVNRHLVVCMEVIREQTDLWNLGLVYCTSMGRQW